MSENITHTAVTDDCARLAVYSAGICEAFKLCLREHHDIARLGGITRGGDRFTTTLLCRYRDLWLQRSEVDMVAEKLAFVLGWLCHRAADRQMKPVFRAADPDCPRSPTDCSVYHDVFLFREVYGGGAAEPYSPGTVETDMASVPGSRAFDVSQIEEVFRVMWQRALIGLHTFIPDSDDVEGWLLRLFRTRQDFAVDISRYAQAFAEPDPDKMQRFVFGVNFYDHRDSIIRLTRSIQSGRPDEGIDLSEALAAAKGQSQYAQALRKGWLYLQSASDYFEGQLDEATLGDRLDVGKPGG